MKDIIEQNKQLWDENVSNRDSYTIPWLDLQKNELLLFKEGKLSGFHKPKRILADDEPVRLLQKELYGSLENKKVLCLASGGGQQSAVFSLLGAKVTVFDISEKQLQGDILAANNYNYEVETVRGNMTELKGLENNSFDYVFQPISACFIPDLRPLYQEVHKKTKKGGGYIITHTNPSTYPVCFDNSDNGFNGVGYCLSEPYKCGPIKVDKNGKENMDNGELTGEYRHSLYDIFCNLTDAGFRIYKVWEDPIHTCYSHDMKPGSHEHNLSVVMQYFNIWCIK